MHGQKKGTLALKTEAVCLSETLVSTYESTGRHNPDDFNVVILAAVRTSDLKADTVFS
jgi:hypothetical protein